MRISPSKLSTYLSCPQKYDYKYVQEIPDGTGQAAINGSCVHEALEFLYECEPWNRTLARALESLDAAFGNWPEAELERCQELVWNLFDLEDPTTVNCRRTELDLELPWGDHSLKGIIDRVDVEDDGYVIVDYKTGKAPRDEDLDERALGIKFYAMLGLKAFGTLPVRVVLLYLGTPQKITFDVTPALARAIEVKAAAAVDAIERGNFKAKPGLACRWCSYKDLCPWALTAKSKSRKVTPNEGMNPTNKDND